MQFRLWQEHIQRFEENRATLQINLAKILVKKESPEKALSVLMQIDAKSLDVQGRENVQASLSMSKSRFKQVPTKYG